MSKHLTVVNTQAEAIEALRDLIEPFVILVKDNNELVYQDNSHCDAVVLVDDWNNANAELPVILKDVSWIKGRRCLVKKTDKGVAICYLDDNNSELFHDGKTVAKLDGSMGQWMTDLPEFNILCVEGESDWVKLHIDREKEIGHKSRRVLLGVTEAVSRNNKLWSCKHSLGSTDSITSTGNLTPITFHNYATALGNGFDIVDYESHCKVAYMFMAKYKNKNPLIMDLFGTGQNDYRKTIGTTSELGNNDGHTDTLISIFGAEDWYEDKCEWMSGIHSNGKTYYIYDGFQSDKIPTVPYRIMNLSKSIITDLGSGLMEMWDKLGYISRMEWGEYSDLIPTETSGSSKYFYPDNGFVGASGWHVVLRSGIGYDSGGGLFYFSSYESSGDSQSNFGSRIQYRGEIEVIDDPQEFINLPVGF